jgi:hypothetical protein
VEKLKRFVKRGREQAPKERPSLAQDEILDKRKSRPRARERNEYSHPLLSLWDPTSLGCERYNASPCPS